MAPSTPPSYTKDVQPASSRNLSHPKRYITTHSPETGKAIFSTTLQEPVPFQQIPNDAIFSLCYATNETPVELSGEKDVATYEQFTHNLPGVMIAGGSVLRLVDMPPGATSPMHRTVSLDYGVVLDGSVELILDSGEKREMQRGDMSVQRGTIHAWRNMSETSWARMLYVLLEAKPLDVGGKKLAEDYGGLEVKASH